MDLSAELKELRKQLYTYRYKSLELERQLRTHCHAFHRTYEGAREDGELSVPRQTDAFENVAPRFLDVFTNNLIVEIITSHLPVQDLLRCRLVCKLWAREMSKFVTQRKALVVAYEDCSEAREILKKKQDGKFVNISTLCILEIPITSQIISDIVKTFGPTLSGLKLDDCNPRPEELYTLLCGIPCLEVLSFKQTGVRSSEEASVGGGNDASSRLDGLSAFCDRLRMTSLKKLAWEEIRPVQYLDRLIQMFPGIEELELMCSLRPDPLRLRNLSIDTLVRLTIQCDNNFTGKHFSALAGLNLKLKKLTLRDLKPGGKGRSRGLKKLLESVSETLLELNLEGMGRLTDENNAKEFVLMSTAFPIRFPSLRKLDIDCSLMTDLNLLDDMPQLQKFECKFTDWKGWWHLLNKGGVPGPHKNIRQVCLGAIDSGCLLKISSTLVAVTKLDLTEDRIDDVAFRVICQKMTHLSHLRVTTSPNHVSSKKLHLTDSGLTGIPLEDCERLRSEPEKNEDEIKALRKHAYVGNLTGLHCLELACSESALTDVAVFYGLYDLQRVSTITLPKCKLTDKALKKFDDMSTLLVLELHTSCGVTNAGVMGLREKKKDLVLNLYSDISNRIFL